jgi:hypothetical protein
MHKVPSRARIIQAPANAASRRLKFDCDDCGARPGESCYQLKSWVVPAVPYAGFYTRLRANPHRGRTGPADILTGGPADQLKAELRGRLRALSQRKLGGRYRMDVRRWAASALRTEGELTAKVAELEAMTDLP